MPLAGVTASQDALSDVVKVSVPPPVLATDSVCAAGCGAADVAVNDRLAGVTESAGGGAGVQRQRDRDQPAASRRRPRDSTRTVAVVACRRSGRPC